MYVNGPVFVPAAEAPEQERAQFIRLTYLHLGGAIVAFVALTAFWLQTPLTSAMMQVLAAHPASWLAFLGGFMLAGWVANAWAKSATSKPMQYAGLALYVLAESIIFIPLLYVASTYAGPDVIPIAGLLTVLVFVGLSGTVFITKKDFSFLGKFLLVGMLAAMALIVGAILFGFTLGLLFSVAMVVLAAGYVLYYTSKVLHHYPVGSHVAASLALFSAIALLFWYILRIVMAARR